MNQECYNCENRDQCPKNPVQGIGINTSELKKFFPKLTEEDIATLKKARPDVRLELAIKLMKLNETSTKDPLTDLYNRRFLEDRLREIFALSQRHKKQFSVIYADIDHFKDVNDNHGHAAGDETLKIFAEILNNLTRQEDIVARLGGEEFVILLPETDIDQARIVAEKLRKEIARADILFQGSRIKITSSFGVAKMMINNGDNKSENSETPQSLLQRADACIYEAKEGGRNRVVTEIDSETIGRLTKITTA
ncbi:MAG: GGDEF domain-containing protein [Candidatus Peribacteraceae bacterium]|nr:GGDEF domain-containing protein [Candidatus Peribacteraceae bacterium]